MQNKWIGGGFRTDTASLQDFVPGRIPGDGCGVGWQSAVGLSTNGLPVTTWGKVTGVYYSPITDSHWFYIDDGFGAVADYGDKGVLIYSDAEVNEGDFVSVTGISGVETSYDNSSRLMRMIETRNAADVQVRKRAKWVSKYPFSDEFDSPTLDSRWTGPASYNSAYWSLTSNPGWMDLNSQTSNYAYMETPRLYQLVPGNWDAEIKLRHNLPTPRFGTYLHVIMTDKPYLSMAPDSACLAHAGMDWGTSYATTFLSLAGQRIGPVDGNTCYFRIRLRRPVAYVSASFDGVNYTNEYSIPTNHMYMVVYGQGDNSNKVACTVSIDYIRFTRVDQQEGQ